MRDKVLDFVEKNGPVLPTAISKALKLNSILAGAFLSSLTSSKVLKVSDLKVGSSPLYFCPGQEDQLQKFSSNLNEKDFRTYLLLKENVVVRDDRCDALTRVSLDQIKDFAIPLRVTFQGAEIKFWKWYMADESDVNAKVAELLGVVQPQEEVQPEAAPQVDANLAQQQAQEVVQENQAIAQPVQTAQQVAAAVEQQSVESNVQPSSVQETSQTDSQENEYGILIEKIQKTEETQSKRIEELEKLVRNLVDQKTSGTEKVKEETSQADDSSADNFVDNNQELPKHLKHLKSLLAQQDIKSQTDDDLYKDFEKLAKKENFTINNFKVVRKGSEIDAIVDLNMFFGTYRFFVKVKSKKTATQKDFDSVKEAADHLELPGLLVCSGDLSKKVVDELKSNNLHFFKLK